MTENMSDEISRKELCERYQALYPGAVADVLDDRGLQDQTMHPDLSPLTKDMHLAGIAFPVVGRANRSVDPETNIRNILEMLGDAPAETALAYDANDDQFAHLGELSATAQERRDVRGAVIDGGVRDVKKMLDLDFPVFRRYNTPADAVPRWELLDWNVETVVGGVNVRPGDLLVGDVDGVVVVPQEHRESVLLEAEEIAKTENDVRSAVENGMDPLDAYEKYGKF